MTSIERKEARYQRRVAARRERKAARLSRADDFQAVFTYENLYEAYTQCRKGVSWKASVQKYITNAPLNLYNTHRLLMTDKYKSPGFFEFTTYERGKKRRIRSTVIGERIVQRCLCDNSLVPMLSNSFIYDNGAAMKFKGYDFAMRRLEQHLHEHYRKYGQEGYILLFDFSKFFDSVDHGVVKGIIRKRYTDARIISLVEHFIDMFGEVGLGLGSQISQVLALASADRLDHYIKEVLRIRGYGRYMDDGYLIHHDKEYLQNCLVAIKALCDELGITLNTKKTQIVKLTHGFTWLKCRFYLTDTGKVVHKIYKRSITKMRRKLKKLRVMLDAGKIKMADVEMCWQSWHSYASRFDAYHTIRNMRMLYDNLFLPMEGCFNGLSQSYECG